MTKTTGLRIVAEGADEAPHGRAASARSVEMPHSIPKLSTLLAGDRLLCVKPRSAQKRSPEECSSRPLDPDLVRVMQAWPTLAPGIRAAVMALVESQRRRDEG
jgi:hypothetical protein